MLLKAAVKLYALAGCALRPIRNQRGAQAIEYIGVAALAVVLIMALITLFGGTGGDTIAQKLFKKLSSFIDSINTGSSGGSSGSSGG